MSVVDDFVGQRLAELAQAGLADDTIVFYFGDHGPGLPRGKRWLYQSGLHVPLIVYVPAKYRALAPDGYAPGAALDRLVSFVDLAPTVLSLAGVAPPALMQGRAFMGPHTAAAPEHLFGQRGRMDERYDLSRAARDRRFLYIRNYMPHRIYGQYLWYMFETPTTRVWRALYDAGRLSPPRTAFWQAKPPEELYDLDADPHNVADLAGDPAHAAALGRLRAALDAHMRATRDLGLLPESDMRARAGTTAPYAMGHDPKLYDVEPVMAAAGRAIGLAAPEWEADLGHADPGVRFWAATGLLIAGADQVEAHRAVLRRGLADAAAAPRIACAEALARHGGPTERRAALDVLLEAARLDRHGQYVAMLALNALIHVGDLPADARTAVSAVPVASPAIHARERDYLPRLTEAVLDGLR
jgi:uncharacterized sulfatase